MSTGVRIGAHAVLFVLAIVVFYFGLAVGLQVNPLAGTALWIVAAGMIAGNVFWIVRS